jgi:hypothetical protein
MTACISGTFLLSVSNNSGRVSYHISNAKFDDIVNAIELATKGKSLNWWRGYSMSGYSSLSPGLPNYLLIAANLRAILSPY